MYHEICQFAEYIFDNTIFSYSLRLLLIAEKFQAIFHPKRRSNPGNKNKQFYHSVQSAKLCSIDSPVPEKPKKKMKKSQEKKGQKKTLFDYFPKK